MTKEKIKKLEKYLSGLQQRLESVVPEKHKNHPIQFQAFLKNEIRIVKNQLDRAKLDGAA